MSIEQIDVSFLCVCPVIDDEFRHNIVKVAVDPRGDGIKNDVNLVNRKPCQHLFQSQKNGEKCLVRISQLTGLPFAAATERSHFQRFFFTLKKQTRILTLV